MVPNGLGNPTPTEDYMWYKSFNYLIEMNCQQNLGTYLI